MDGVVYACDIGSVKPRTQSFAWSRNVSLADAPSASKNIDELITSIVADAKNGASISLGLEAPLFLPVPVASCKLNSGRNGEKDRSMFAQAGAVVTTIAIQQASWILKRLRERLADRLHFTTDWKSGWRTRPQKLLLWEAFVSSTAHSDTHERDATTAVQSFLENEHDFAKANAVTCESPLSLISVAALWSGWLQDASRLHGDCLVLRPSKPYSGPIKKIAYLAR